MRADMIALVGARRIEERRQADIDRRKAIAAKLARYEELREENAQLKMLIQVMREQA